MSSSRTGTVVPTNRQLICYHLVGALGNELKNLITMMDQEETAIQMNKTKPNVAAADSKESPV